MPDLRLVGVHDDGQHLLLVDDGGERYRLAVDESLRGVLRSELREHLATRLREFIRDTLLRASPLVLVGVLGEVAHPGYYRVSLESSLADSLMVRRTSLEHLGVDAGDELVVAAPRTRNWSLFMQIAGLATGALVAFFTIRR